MKFTFKQSKPNTQQNPKHEHLKRWSRHLPFILLILPTVVFIGTACVVGYVLFHYSSMKVYPDGEIKAFEMSRPTSDFSYTAPTTDYAGYTLPLPKFPSNFDSINWDALGIDFIYDNKVFLLRDGGFVSRVDAPNFATLYGEINSQNLPVFITSDSILNYVNNFSVEVMDGIQSSQIVPSYRAFLDEMLKLMNTKYNMLDDGELRNLAEANCTYLYTARKLLDADFTTKSAGRDAAESNVQKISTCQSNGTDDASCSDYLGYSGLDGYKQSLRWLRTTPDKKDGRAWNQRMLQLTLVFKYSNVESDWEKFYPMAVVDAGGNDFLEFDKIDAAVASTFGYSFAEEDVLDGDKMSQFEVKMAQTEGNQDASEAGGLQGQAVWMVANLDTNNIETPSNLSWQKTDVWSHKSLTTYLASQDLTTGDPYGQKPSEANVELGDVTGDIFLEPQAEVYTREKFFMENLLALGESTDLLSVDDIEKLNTNIELLESLRLMSETVASGQALSEEQKITLRDLVSEMCAHDNYQIRYATGSDGTTSMTGDVQLLTMTQVGADGQSVIAFGPVYSNYNIAQTTLTSTDGGNVQLPDPATLDTPANLQTVLNNNNFNDPYDFEIVPQSAGSVRIPVLMYHHIAPIPNDTTRRYYVSPEGFEQQVAWLVAKNYHIMTPDEFAAQLETGQNPAQKSVMLTFDDSPSDNYLNAYPILKKYGVPGVFYVVSQKSGISGDQLREMADNGMIIDSHAATHRDLRALDEGELWSEISGSKAALQGITGKPVYSIAYPGCTADGRGTSIAASSGYLVGFSCGSKIDHYWGQRFVLSRIHVYDDMDNFKKIFSGIWEFPPGYP